MRIDKMVVGFICRSFAFQMTASECLSLPRSIRTTIIMHKQAKESGALPLHDLRRMHLRPDAAADLLQL